MSSPRRVDGANKNDGPLVLWARWIRAGVLRLLSPGARDVAQTLAAYGSREGLMFPAADTLTRLTGRARNTVFRSLKELKDKRIIAPQGHVKRRYRNTKGPVIYHFLTPPEPMSLCDKAVSVTDTAKTNPAERFSRQRCLYQRDGGSTSRRYGGRLYHRDTEGLIEVQSEGAERGVGETSGGLRSASPLEAASLRPPSLEADPVGEPKAASTGTAETRRAAIRKLLDTFSGDRRLTRTFVLKAGYSEVEIAEALAELSAESKPPAPAAAPPPGDGASQTSPTMETPRPPVPVPRRQPSGRILCAAETRAHSECGLRALPGSAFCRWHGGQGEPS